MSLVVPFDQIFADDKGLLANHPSWQRVELGDVCAVINGFPFKSTLFNKKQGIPIVRIRDLSRGATGTLFNGEVPDEAMIDSGDLLIGMDGIFGCVLWQGGKAGLNQRVCKIVPDERFIDRRFLLFGINGYLKAIEKVTSSVTVGHLSSRDILRIPFPLPPFNEQRRIVAKLEKLLDKVDSCQKRLTKIPILLKRFRQAVLAAACSGRLTEDWRERNPSSEFERQGESTDNENTRFILAESCLAGPSDWVVRDLRWLITNLDQGWSPKCHIERSTPPAVWGVIKTTAVQALEFLERENKRLPETLTPSVDLELREGDLLITRAGPRARAGVCCLVRQVRPRLMICDKVYRFRANETRVLAQFLVLALNTPSMTEHIDTLKTGISDSGVNLTQDKFLNLAVPIPPILEQREIVRRVDELFALADQIEARYAKGMSHFDGLKQSILAKAFRGELVQQDPNDEPATVLLERIREARATQPLNRPRQRVNKLGRLSK